MNRMNVGTFKFRRFAFNGKKIDSLTKNYNPETKNAIEQVIGVFQDYIQASPHFELLWPDKVGYIYISIVSVHERLIVMQDGTSIRMDDIMNLSGEVFSLLEIT